MKFNNELSLNDFVTITEMIAKSFFDTKTGEYVPYVGELFAVATYYNYCVELEEGENYTHPITDMNEIEFLFKDVIFMRNYTKAVDEEFYPVRLNWASAYNCAQDIVKQRKEGIAFFTSALSNLLDNYGERIINTIETMDVDKLEKITESFPDGKATVESIVNAFAKTERFQEIINQDDKKVIQMPSKDSDK